MGWDTEIIILAESIKSKESAFCIGEQIFKKDSKRWGKETFFIGHASSEFLIYYTYERRKYAPYWVIQEISKDYPNIEFTILGSMLDFVGGPGGVIRINKGEIIDSYGILGENSIRHGILDSPIKEMNNIHRWFNNNGIEKRLRIQYLKEFPMSWCEGNYSEKIIPINEAELKFQIENKKENSTKIDWIKQPKFQLIPSFEDYSKSLKEKPQNKLEITETSFISFIEYNPIVELIERKIIEILNGEIIKSYSLLLYDTTFGQRSKIRESLEKDFKTIQDIEDVLVKNHEKILEWGKGILGNKENIKLGKGFSFLWFVNFSYKK